MTNSNEIETLANGILDLSRNKLLVNLRFMDVALSYHKRVSYEGSFATDGKAMFYDPRFILRTYKSSQEETVRMYLHMIKQFRQTSAVKKNDPKGEMDKVVAREEKMLEASLNSGALSQSDKICRQKTILYLRELSDKIAGEDNAESAFKIVKKDYNAKVKNLSKAADAVKQKLSNMFLFSEEVFGEGQEILIIVTELTANNKSAVFISQYGCPEYFRHNKDLLFYERQNDILKRIEDLGV